MVRSLKIYFSTLCYPVLVLLFCILVSLSATQEAWCETQPAPLVDEIAIKQHEMLDPIVQISNRQTTGSGTVYEKIETEIDGMFEYRVLTNHHVVRGRMVFSMSADFIAGKLIKISVDTGCDVIVFDTKEQSQKKYTAEVVAEDSYLDLAILSFESDQPITVALLATDEMLEKIRVFDEVFAIGCQLGMRPTPTFGIISQITSGVTRDIKWILYGTTSPISPGSSGGGLFREYDGHYYLIGIPFRLYVLDSDQLMPHLAEAISISTAKNIIHESAVILP